MLNRIIIMGRFVRDPERRSTQSGTPVTSFTLAVERDVKGQNGEKATDFIDCVAWRHTAEFVCSYFTKGRMAVVEGRLQIREWKDRDGNNRRTAEVVAENVYFADSNKAASESQAPAANHGGYPQNTPAPAYAPNYAPPQFGEIPPSEDDGDLPF